MAREHRFLNGQTGKLTVVPFTAEEEAVADQKAIDDAYALNVASARQRKRREELKKAMNKFVTYRDSSPKIIDAQLATYKTDLNATYDTAETAILAINTGTVDGDIIAIRDFVITWPEPA